MKTHFYFIGYFVLICILLWFQYRDLNLGLDLNKENFSDNYDFFFIHGYKTMGTTIYAQLPNDYNKKYYGKRTIDEYEKINNIKLNKNVVQSKFKNTNKLIAFDHIPLDQLYDLGILNDEDIKNKQCMCIIREPIERFISICNFQKSSPSELIEEVKEKGKTGGDQYKQSKFYKQKYGWNIKLIKMENKDEIIRWFKQFGININFDIHEKKSIHKYTVNDLTDEQISYLKELYKEDYDVYNLL
jgi:hypothetical protein